MEYTFEQYLTLDDFKEQTGYDLTKRVEQGDFETLEEAAKNFMQTCFDELVDEVIKPQNGDIWTNNFLQDILTDADDNYIIGTMKKGFIKAFKEHCLYRFEVGDPVAVGSSNLPRYSEHTIQLLCNARIIQRSL